MDEQIYDLVPSIEQEHAERLVICADTTEEPDARKQEVGLALGGGNAVQEPQEVGILSHTEREPLVQRRSSARLASGELPVQLSGFVLSHSPRLTSPREYGSRVSRVRTRRQSSHFSLVALASAGFRTESTDPRWLYKAWMACEQRERSVGTASWMASWSTSCFGLLAPSGSATRQSGGADVSRSAVSTRGSWRRRTSPVGARQRCRRCPLALALCHWRFWPSTRSIGLSSAANEESGLRVLGLLLYARTEGICVPDAPINRNDPGESSRPGETLAIAL
jgi:hypothetical protein